MHGALNAHIPQAWEFLKISEAGTYRAAISFIQ
jgi:hypothetical protein